jgi:demethylspheroidene O-methyltransferase
MLNVAANVQAAPRPAATVPPPADTVPHAGAAGWRAWRDRLLADERFQRWITRVPLLRAIARRHAASLFDLCTGFIHSQVLYTCVRIGLLEALRDGALPLPELQRRCGLSASDATLLIAASDALGLTEPRAAQTRGLGMLGAALLGNSAVLRMIEHQPLFYADLADPVGLLQGTAAPGELAQFWGYARHPSPGQLPARAVGGYTGLMSATQSLVAGDLLDAYPFRKHRCLLDVGGGDGMFLCSLALRAPALRLMLFDLPAVAERGRARLAAAGLGERSEVHGGDFTSAELPAGADVVSLLRVLHDHDDVEALALLRAVRRALPLRGRVVIAEPMRAVPGSLPAAETYLGFYLLAMGQGRVRRVDEIKGLLASAGFVRARVHRTERPWQCAVISAVAS